MGPRFLEEVHAYLWQIENVKVVALRVGRERDDETFPDPVVVAKGAPDIRHRSPTVDAHPAVLRVEFLENVIEPLVMTAHRQEVVNGLAPPVVVDVTAAMRFVRAPVLADAVEINAALRIFFHVAFEQPSLKVPGGGVVTGRSIADRVRFINLRRRFTPLAPPLRVLGRARPLVRAERVPGGD